MILETFNISIEKLDAAMRNVLGADVFDAIKNSSSFNRPHVHDMAIRKAYIYGASANDEYVLKAAASVLDEHGFYKRDGGHE